MKKSIIYIICLVIFANICTFNISAVNESVPNEESSVNTINEMDARATGLILSYGLEISKSGNSLTIIGTTYCNPDVVKCGFKNLVVERRLNSSSDWEEYHDYGNVYVETAAANLSTSLTVESGYQYRVTTKHYAKQNIILVQTISNESNIIQF